MKRWCLLVVVMGMLLGCTGNEVRLSAAVNGSQRTVKVGQIISLSLAANPSTGYSWQLKDDIPAQLEQMGEPSYRTGLAALGRVGAGGTQTFRFRVLKEGSATLTLGYLRSWETTAPLETFTVILNAIPE